MESGIESAISFTPKDLEDLMRPGPGPRVSIYLSAHPLASEASRDTIVLKNLLKHAEELLLARGLRRPDAETMLRDACELLGDGGFWRGEGRGIALFVSQRGTRVFRLPLAFAELISVAEHFHIKPLLPLLSGDGRYHLLALSRSRVRLLTGDRFRAWDVTPVGLPTNLAEALRFDVLEKQTQVHTAGPAKGAGAGRAAMFHGHGGTERDEKGRTLEYFRHVDAGVHERLVRERGPLVLAGVGYLRSIYREANSYADLVEEGIPGSPDGLSMSELHERASAVLASRFEAGRREASERFLDRLGTGLAVSDLKEVLAVSLSGRVDTLFVALDRQQWGTFDPLSGEIDLHDEPLPGDEDLLDQATAQTLLQRGRVFAVSADEVPGGTAVAALLRY